MVELTSRSRRVLVGATIAVVAAGCVGAGVVAGRALDDGGAAAPAALTSADLPVATFTPTSEPTRDLTPIATPTSAPRSVATPSEPAVTPSPVTTAEATVATQLSTPSSPPRASASPPGVYSQGTLTAGDLASRGSGMAGRGPLNADRIIITAAGVDAGLTIGVVGPDGQLPSPPNKDTAIWYDFANWPGLGGAPGRGGNIVIAGDAGRPGQGPGVFSRVPRLVPGDYIRLRGSGASAWCYRVEFNKIASSAVADYTAIVSATADESVTLITAGRTLNERTIVWARSASCGSEPRPTPARTP
jgi:hypothetical protein